LHAELGRVGLGAVLHRDEVRVGEVLEDQRHLYRVVCLGRAAAGTGIGAGALGGVTAAAGGQGNRRCGAQGDGTRPSLYRSSRSGLPVSEVMRHVMLPFEARRRSPKLLRQRCPNHNYHFIFMSRSSRMVIPPLLPALELRGYPAGELMRSIVSPSCPHV